MKVISFNINGIRARIHQLEALIDKHQPDIIGLQEIKVADEMFPLKDLAHLGYHIYHHGQKGHYGVAYLCKQEPVRVSKGFPGDDEDAQRRMIIVDYPTADGGVVRVLNGYFPQGESRDHETKFPAKKKFYEDLQSYLEIECKECQHVVVMGDFNISPQDSDIGIGEPNRKRWLKTGKCSFLPEEREWYQRLLGWGLTDTYRHINPDQSDIFSWFDYRSKGFDDEPKRGLRIDHILVTPALLDSLAEVGIDYELRGMEKPSDHCPIWAGFNL
jgi:exodeoxyribonuclease-3|tara:strand:- start:240 stop:1055 length:816 start_codon:yes stop_codon:yes gene_type:complete